MATSADSSFSVDKIDVEEWEKLFDTALVAFVAHKLEELIREILGDVFIWCPKIAYIYRCNPPVDALPTRKLVNGLLRNNSWNLSHKREEIFKWMNGSRLPLGNLIARLDELRSTELNVEKWTGQRPVQWSFYDPSYLILDKVRANRWKKLLLSGEKSLQRLLGNEYFQGILWDMNEQRNSVIHHGKRFPCLKLTVDERNTLIMDYKMLIESDPLKIISDGDIGTTVEEQQKITEAKRTQYRKAIEISDWREIYNSYIRLEDDLRQEKEDRVAERESHDGDLQQQKAKNNESKIQIADLKSKLEKLHEERKVIGEKLEAALKQEAVWKRQQASSVILIGRLESEVEKHKAKAKSAEEKYFASANDMRALNITINELKRKNKTLKEQLESALQHDNERPEKVRKKNQRGESSPDPNQQNPESNESLNVGDNGATAPEPLSIPAEQGLGPQLNTEVQSQNPVNPNLVQQLAATAAQQNTYAPTGGETGSEQAVELDNSIPPVEEGE